MFANTNSADCGDFTNCGLKPLGCGSGTYSGKAFYNSALTRVEVVQNEDYGYNEYLCVECENSVGSKTSHDNWHI